MSGLALRGKPARAQKVHRCSDPDQGPGLRGEWDKIEEPFGGEQRHGCGDGNESVDSLAPRKGLLQGRQQQRPEHDVVVVAVVDGDHAEDWKHGGRQQAVDAAVP